ncbi:MAG: polysulfide reductase [Desulfobulbaceae bacterium]|nr:MAG: polysulfide reductase [Desulfobulbaceae bacterium]
MTKPPHDSVSSAAFSGEPGRIARFVSGKILMAKSPKQYLTLVFSNPFNWLLAVVLAIGIPLLIQRYATGLGSVTHGSQDYPWGLLLGFGLFGMVPLSASGFLLSTAVEIFGRHDLKPIERLALLNGLLGYFFAVVYLLVDLGMPWRLTYPMFVSFGPAAVLFLVAWHVATYLSVQIGEMIPAFAEWIGWDRGKKFIKRITLGLTIAGIILSTLHQGALGALFCYAPGKIHPLWISPEFQWIHFFCSSIYAGLCMVIVVSTLVAFFLRLRCDENFKNSLDRITITLSRGAAYAMVTYLVIKLVALAHDQEWGYLLTGWGGYYVSEMVIGVILPLVLLTYGSRHHLIPMLRIGSLLAVLGILWNRLNTVILCYNWKLHQEIPHFKEVWLVLTILAIYIITYRFILYRLPVLFTWKESDRSNNPAR